MFWLWVAVKLEAAATGAWLTGALTWNSFHAPHTAPS